MADEFEFLVQTLPSQQSFPRGCGFLPFLFNAYDIFVERENELVIVMATLKERISIWPNTYYKTGLTVGRLMPRLSWPVGGFVLPLVAHFATNSAQGYHVGVEGKQLCSR